MVPVPGTECFSMNVEKMLLRRLSRWKSYKWVLLGNSGSRRSPSTDRNRIRNPDVGGDVCRGYLVELGLDSILEDKILLSNVGPLQAVNQLSPGRYPVPDLFSMKKVLPPLQNMAMTQK